MSGSGRTFSAPFLRRALGTTRGCRLYIEFLPAHVGGFPFALTRTEEKAHKPWEGRCRLRQIEGTPDVPDLVVGQDALPSAFCGLGSGHASDNGRDERVVPGRPPVECFPEPSQGPVRHHGAVLILDRVEQINYIAPSEARYGLLPHPRPHVPVKHPLHFASAAEVPTDVALEEAVEKAVDAAGRSLLSPRALAFGGRIPVAGDLACPLLG